MKGYWKIIAGYTVIALLLGVILYQMLFSLLKEKQASQDYKIQINRYLMEDAPNPIDREKYPNLLKIESVQLPIQKDTSSDFFKESNDSYLIIERGNQLYRFTYKVNEQVSQIQHYLIFIYLILICGGYVLLWILYRKIIHPFWQVSEYPLLLAKGEMTPQITIKKGNYFRNFVWGLNMLRDHLTQQRKNEMDLYKERQTLILSISHDIKTPLQTIKLYAQALKKGIVVDEAAKIQAYSQIDEKAEEIQNSVNDIMDATKRQFLDFSVEEGEFYLNDLLEQAQKTHQERLKQEGVTLRILQSENYLLQGDWKRYCEIMDNLMDNSLKYGDHQEISFSTTLEEDCVLLMIENTGCTLNPEELIYIFDSFRRGFNHSHLPGSGLGLYIVRNLMKQMKGEVYARIQDEKFQITLVIPKAS